MVPLYAQDHDYSKYNVLAVDDIPLNLLLIQKMLSRFTAKVGELIAQNAKEAGITTVVFDRNGFLYHGRVKELADAARKGGLNF